MGTLIIKFQLEKTHFVAFLVFCDSKLNTFGQLLCTASSFFFPPCCTCQRGGGAIDVTWSCVGEGDDLPLTRSLNGKFVRFLRSKCRRWPTGSGESGVSTRSRACVAVFYKRSGFCLWIFSRQRVALPWEEKEQRDGKHDTDGASAGSPANR